jgi:hypothetical protein
MSDERSTHDSLSDGNYQTAVETRSDQPTRTAVTATGGRVVSTSRSAGSLTIRITTRPAPMRRSTE